MAVKMFQGFFGFLLVLCLLVSPCLKLHGQTQNHCGSALPESGFREVKNVQLSWAIFQSWSYLTHALSSVETGICVRGGTWKSVGAGGHRNLEVGEMAGSISFITCSPVCSGV